MKFDNTVRGWFTLTEIIYKYSIENGNKRVDLAVWVIEETRSSTM